MALSPLWLICQNAIGIPHIRNFSNHDYNAGTQNWDIRQDKSGIMYFANNDGLLSFDGTNWKTFPLPKRTNVRSLDIVDDNKIYVGGQDEIGYFTSDNRGVLSYTSLINLLSDEDKSFADIWDVVSFDHSVFFHSTNRIFQLVDGKINSYLNPHWRFMGLGNKRLIAQTEGNELLAFTNGVWKPFLTKSNLPKDFMVTAIIPFTATTSLLVTLKNGIYILSENSVSAFNTPDLDLITTKRIYGACRIAEDKFALATTLGGCYVVDSRGHLVQNFSTKEGLQNNNILNVALDRDKNIWLGLDNGIDFITYNNAIKHIYPGNQDEGSGYTSAIFHEHLYIGTSNGLYSVPLSSTSDLSFIKGSFKVVANAKGQVWNLSEVNGQLLMGHHEGSFLVKDNEAVLIDSSSGFWNYLPMDNVIPSTYMIAGTYKGLNFYNYQNGHFKKSLTAVPTLSARFVTVDGHTIWISHPYKGIFKVQMIGGQPSPAKRYTERNGLPTANNNYIYKVKNHVVAATVKGLYEYNTEKDVFEPSSYFKNIFGEKSIRYLKEDPSGNIWFIAEKNLGVVDMSGEKIQTIYFPELTNKMVKGFEHILPIDSANILLGGEKGFYHINFAAYKKNNTRLDVFIRTVKAVNKTDSLLFGGYPGQWGKGEREHSATVDHDWNSFHFDFSSTQFAQQPNLEYSFKLEGFDKSWSEWAKKTEKEYTNLPAGTYTFLVKARNNFGNESLSDQYTIRVKAPWYQSTWAYLFYMMLFFAGIWFLYKKQQEKFKRQQEKHDEEQHRLQYLHQLEMDKAEKELIQLRNEKLEAEIHAKNNELASSAMHLVQKNESLSKIKKEFTKLRKNAESQNPDDLKKISKMFGAEDRLEKDWEHFAIHFDKVHSDFLLALKHAYPNLNANELKLSTYLRMNLSTKEIAQLMSISVRGVEISRYRLRKKLEVPTGVNLFNFLLDFNNKISRDKM